MTAGVNPTKKVQRTASRRQDASQSTVLRRLWPPLAALVVLLTVGAGVLLWQQQRQQLSQEISTLTAMVNRDFQVDLANQAAGLSMALQPIAADATVQKALQEGDADRLLAAWGPVFKTLHRNNSLTHFYFFDPQRVCLLRVHKPEKRGDLINRFTAREAERTGKTASGIELGPLGTFTLRVVQPVFSPAGTLVGYVELGKEIEDVLRLRRTSGLELAVVVSKQHLSRQSFEEGQRFLQREADWDRLPHSVVIYASQGRLPDAFAPIVDDPGRRLHADPEREIIAAGRDWRVSATALHDASGQAVGKLLVMKDITPENEAFVHLLLLGGATGGGLMALLLGFIVVLLRRTDARIDAQRKDLQDSLQFQRDLIDAVPSPIFYKDAQGAYLGSNSAFERDLGLSSEQLIGKTVHELSPADLAEKYDQADRALLNNPGVQTYEARVVYADGTRHDVIFNKATFANTEGQVAGLIGVMMDISERKQAEEKLHLAASVFSHAREGIMITDSEARSSTSTKPSRASPATDRDEALGRNPRFLNSGRQDRAFYAELWRRLIDDGHWYGEIWNRRKNGDLYAEMQNISTVYDANGKPSQYVALFSDITVRSRNTKEARTHRALRRALTTLPNRVLLADRMHQAMAQAQRREPLLAVAYLDLDGFKTINDHHGHETGDLLLIALAGRMKDGLREGDTLARMGGDEFVAVLLDLDDAADSLPMLNRLLAPRRSRSRSASACCRYRPASASPSIRKAKKSTPTSCCARPTRRCTRPSWPARIATTSSTPTRIAACADSPRKPGADPVRARQRRIRAALTSPRSTCAPGTVIGAEALIRWQHPEAACWRRLEFLPVIEDHPLAVERRRVGDRYGSHPDGMAEAWARPAGQRQYRRAPVAASRFCRSLQRSSPRIPSFKPGDLELEVLETSALEDLERVSRIITACRQKSGVAFLARRLRHRLFVAHLSEAPVSHAAQDRPELCARHARRPGRSGHSRRRPRPGDGLPPQGDRRGRRNRRARRNAAAAGL
jgi:diguanylate cyclase (GGDEF)-like protein/PAS domain S-box-containing protein